MTQYSYCEIWSSGSALGGKFAVVRDGYQKITIKNANVEETMDGGIDVQFGGVRDTYNYIIRVRHTEPESGYGTYDDLRDLYSINNPSDALLWHVDHHGNVEQVYMVGNFMGNLLGCQIEGETAWWDVQVELRVKPT